VIDPAGRAVISRRARHTFDGGPSASAPHIGTAGWAVPRIVAERFPGEVIHLQRYARETVCVEINPYFSRIHRREVDPRWGEPRHASLATPAADAWLARHHNGRTAADPARWPGAAVPGGWLGFAACHLPLKRHGPPGAHLQEQFQHDQFLRMACRRRSHWLGCQHDHAH
jgi:hypothetical protein